MLTAAGAAAAAGARVFIATSSQGLLCGFEMLYTIAGWRVPLVLVNVSRGLSSPITFEADHNDILAARDSGFIQMHTETCQEVIVGRFKPIVTLLQCLARWRILHQKMARFQAGAEELGQHISMTLTAHVSVFLLAQSITCLSALSLFIRPWLFFWFLPGTRPSFAQLCALFVLTNLVNLLTVVPGGLGWFEASMAGYASAAGLGDDKGVAFALVSRIADVTLLTMGSWLILHYGVSGPVPVDDGYCGSG